MALRRTIMLGAAMLACVPVAALASAAPRLERIVMLMRHGIRPPTKAQPIPVRYAPDPWPTWDVAPGLLTANGAKGAALLGAADRAYLVRVGVLPARGCAPGAVAVHASAKQRAIRTAEAWAAAALPGCALTVEHPPIDGADPIFHGLDDRPATFDGRRAYAAALALAPPRGLAAEQAAHAGEIALLERVLGCAAPACDLEGMTTTLLPAAHDRPELDGPLDIGSTASQSILLEYLDGKPMRDVGWGRVTRAEIERLLRFHPVKFKYNNRPAYIAAQAAAPLAGVMTAALAGTTPAGRVTLLTGHDTNIADMAGLLDLHWQVPSYPADDVPPGSALGFELWRGAGGTRYVRAFYRAQTMDQLRSLARIDGAVGPWRRYLDVPGCGTAQAPQRCTLARFRALVATKLAAGQAATAP